MQTARSRSLFKRFLGYDRGEDGSSVINEEWVEIVRRIFGMFLKDYSLLTIVKTLIEESIPTQDG